MNLGISSYTYPWAVKSNYLGQDFRSQAISLIKKAIAQKVSTLQICDNLPLHTLTPDQCIEIAKFAEESGIRIEVGTRGLTPENIKRYIDIAVAFKSPFVRVVIDDVDYAPQVNEIIKIIQAILPLLKAHEVILAIENHDRFPSATLAKIVRETDTDFVGICLDTANSLGAGEGVNEVFHELQKYTVNLHVKDIRIERLAHKMGFTVLGCAAGDGDLDIPCLLKKIEKKKDISVTLEIWSDFYETIEKTIAREEQWANKSIEYLNKITFKNSKK